MRCHYQKSICLAVLLLLGIDVSKGQTSIGPGGQLSPPLDATPIPMPELPKAVPDEERLSLSQAVQIGLRDNPQITSSHYAIESAHQNYLSQKSPINPTINYAALNNTVSPIDWSTGFSQGANYSAYATLETNGAIRYRTWQAREQFHQAQFDASTTGLSLSLSIISAFESLQVANRELEVELKVYDNMVKLSDLTQKRYEAGAGQQADAIRARIAAIQEQQNVIADVANVNGARANLNTQLGHPQSSPIDVKEPLNYQPLAFGNLEELTKQAIQNRPELKSAMANLKSLEAVPGLQRSEYFPNVVFGMDFGGDGLFVGLSMPLDLGGIRGAVNKAKADVKTQQAQVELQRQAVELDVKSSYINLLAAQRQVETYQSGGILKMSETLVDQIRHGYELGANTIVDIITAENTYRSVESAYYIAVGAYVVAAFTLKHSISDLPDAIATHTLARLGTSVTASSAAVGGGKQ